MRHHQSHKVLNLLIRHGVIDQNFLKIIREIIPYGTNRRLRSSKIIPGPFRSLYDL